MKYLIGGISLPLGQSDGMQEEILKRIKIPKQDLKEYHIVKKSIDARKKPDVKEIYSVCVETACRIRGFEEYISVAASIDELNLSRNRTGDVLVVGMGPAGLFTALTLIKGGCNVTLIERGEPVEQRDDSVRAMKERGILQPESNIQFGEGGAGTYSDGKLNTGIKSGFCRAVLGEFVRYGAPVEVLYHAKPHVGTDKLKTVVKNLRADLEKSGAKIHFGAKLTKLKRSNDVTAEWTENGRTVRGDFDAVFLAIGHSARDTFQMLFESGFPMAPKAFSIGVRIEHPQIDINRAQYGRTDTPPADYKLAAQLGNGRGVYTFCMCPGGEVVAAANEEGGVVTNGMSEYARGAENANSALLVGVGPEDFPNSHPLAGVEFQRRYERAAYRLGGGNYTAPAQLVGDFLKDRPSQGALGVLPSYRPAVAWENLREVLPDYVADGIGQGILAFDKKLRGFARPDAVMTGVETRSSSPVRILRGEDGKSPWGNVYPVGEGAGYAGGITSAAVDGIRAAAAYLKGEN